MDEWLGLPTDLQSHIVNYLDCTTDLTKLRLCSHKTSSTAIEMLDLLSICLKEPFGLPSRYVGAHPRRLEITEWTASKTELTALETLLPMVQELSITIHDYSHESIADMCKSFGKNLANVRILEFVARDEDEMFGEMLLQWIPHMKNLEELDLIMYPVYTKSILEALAKHCKLRQLTLRHPPLLDFEVEVDLSITDDLDTSLLGLTHLHTLIIPEKCREVETALEQAEVAVTLFSDCLDQFKLLLPEQLRSLKGVFIRAHARHSDVYFTAPCFGYFYALCENEEVCAFLLNEIKHIGIDTNFDGGSALTFLLTVETITPETKLHNLIHAGANIYATCNIMVDSQFNFTVGNAFHLLVRCAAPETVTLFLDSVFAESPIPLDNLRAQNGYTPLHFVPLIQDTWGFAYEKLVKIYPDILFDSKNVKSWSPVMAIHAARSMGCADPSHVIAITRRILNDVVKLHQNETPSLFAQCFDFYAFFLRVDTVDISEFDIILQPILEQHLTFLRKSKTPVTLETLGFVESTDRDIQASRILLSNIYHHQSNESGPLATLFPQFLPRASRTALSFALRSVCYYTNYVLPFLEASKMLIEAGADPNFVENGVNALWIFVISRDPGADILDDEDDEEFQEAIINWKEFWAGFWFLVDSGAQLVSDQHALLDHLDPSAIVRYGHAKEDTERLLKLLVEIKSFDDAADIFRFFVYDIVERPEEDRVDILLGIWSWLKNTEAAENMQPLEYFEEKYNDLLATGGVGDAKHMMKLFNRLKKAFGDSKKKPSISSKVKKR